MPSLKHLRISDGTFYNQYSAILQSTLMSCSQVVLYIRRA